MKVVDAALLSLAIGLSAATAYLFASDYPSGFVNQLKPIPTATRVPRRHDFQAIVIHGPHDACPRSAPGSRDVQAHFIVHAEDADGEAWVEATPRWLDQLGATHSRNAAVNRHAIAVWVDAPTSPGQAEALRRLTVRLREEFGIPPAMIFSHADVDVGTGCGAGRGLASLRTTGR